MVYPYTIMVHAGIFLENKFREGQIESFENRGDRTLIILKSISSLRHNSEGENHFQGGTKCPLCPPRKIPVHV